LDIQAKHQAAHARVFRGIVCRDRISRQILWLHHVKRHMAMHQPVTGTLGCPGHIKRSTGQHLLRDNLKPLLRSEFLKMILIAYPIHLKIEPVQMHGVVGIAGINPPPVYGLADLEDESFSIRPGFSVYRW